MTSTLKFLGILIAGAVIGALAVSATKGSLGGVYTQVENTFRQGIKVGTTNQFTVSSSGAVSSSGDATISGGTFTVTTSNTATSTATFGCWQSYATSTATSLKLQFTASTTAPTNGSGIIPVISYGTCPNL